MASSASPVAVNGGKSSEPGAPSRGGGRGGPRGRGGRGRGGRPANGKGGASSKPDVPSAKPAPSANHAQEKPSSDLPKSPVPPSSAAPANPSQDPQPPKASTRPKPARRGSEHKGPRRGPSLTVDSSVTSTSNPSTSPSVSPRTPSRRKRGNSKASQQSATAPAAPVPPVPRKPSLTSENGVVKEKAVPVPKDPPPHLAPPPPKPVAPFDIKHDIDALVERVRAVAMDRPHTPGSHIDWAGDDDDSLPDLDDWGVHPTTVSLDVESVSESSVASIISPILQDTLKPLPTLNDIDIPTPSIRLHEVHDDGHDGHAGDETPRETVPPNTASSITPTGAARSRADVDAGHSAAPSSVASLSNKGSAKPSRTPSPPKDGVAASRHASALSSRDIPSKDSSPSPSDRSLSASIHALSPSPSAPTHLGPRPPRAGFNPSHARAHTVGRFKTEAHSDSDRPRRGDAFAHGRNHSTPPTGPGTAHAHARTTHATRPVISVDAISRLARTLGGAPLPRRDKEPVIAAVKAE
ncbi:hypothetical protein PsYK624_004740 [Phanerochaete sordida]|uniref:Uncharacterized protein n=1 Tax=Phanerochaete sordida TaxID=48140 RepID=A0A9P3FXI4_9APHY|nr:hypothetical protein PsYK624_004740 [Phanerochaete sordida]